jgi:Protein of unknown function (DUF3443)
MIRPRRSPVPRLLAIALFASLILATGCGGGGGSSNNGGNNGGGGGGGAVANSVPIVVNAGPTNQAVDTAFVSVTVCTPGTSTCQTIPNIAVDTGSMGLRVLKSALTVSLPQAKATTGNPLVECAQFLSFFTWGPVASADIKMAGEVASSAPIQVIDESQFPVPATCKATAPTDGDTLQTLQANGILGVGLFLQDCGGACSPASTNNPGFYYQCPTPATCAVTTATTAQQVPNPVAMFASDNNGVLIQLPALPAAGAPSASGTMIFGIGTQSNNGLGSATVLTTDSQGTITTVYQGVAYPGSFIDSGSNGIFFLTGGPTGITKIPLCTTSIGFYCPPSPLNLSATNRGINNASSTVKFTIINIDDTTQAPPANFAFDDIGGEQAGPPPAFDWGLAFFFGRNVFTAIETRTTPGGTGPFFAY